MIRERMRLFTSNDRARTNSLRFLACLLNRRQQGRVGVFDFECGMKGQCSENCLRRKTVPAKNGAGEKLVPAKHFAGEICGEKYDRRNLRRQTHADKIAVELYFGEEQILKWRNSG